VELYVSRMSQGFQIGWIRSVGIVPVLFGMGFALVKFRVMTWFGWVLIIFSGLIGITYGFLGVLGILEKMGFIEIKKIALSLNSFVRCFKKDDNFPQNKSHLCG